MTGTAPIRILSLVLFLTLGLLGPSLARAEAAAPRLQLTYRGVSGPVDRAVAPLLAAFAAEYGPDGLAVAAASDAADRRAGVRSLAARSPAAAPAAALTLQDSGGGVLLALPADALDLYAVYRICERELRGRGRTSYPQHVRRLLESHLATDDLLVPIADQPLQPVSAVLVSGSPGVLFLPPGCSPCLLAKHEAAVRAAVVAAPERPLLAFEPAVVSALRDLGWRGAGYLLPLEAGARILGLRQGGSYRPVLVRRAGPAGVTVQSLATPEDRP